MTDERHIKADIPAFLSHALPESRRREVEAHVVDCERCRHALEKAKAKQSRQRRQALKTAQPGSANLFLNRLSKQGDVERKSSGGLWIWLLLFAAVGVGAYWLSHHEPRWWHIAPPIPPSTPTVAVSTETAAAPAVTPVASTPTVSAPIRIAEVNASSPIPTAADSDEPETPRFWSGSDSSVKDERQVVVKGRSIWRALWLEMGHTDPAPRVNFNSTLVVAIFAGEKPSAGYTVQIKDPQDEEDSTLVAYSVDTPPASSTVPQVLTHPYALRTIPRGDKPVRFLEETVGAAAAAKEKTP